ncbi:DNA repair protein REV1 isoform X4 [Eurytemora carolleeae]|uniref:DNA repair protein REV1 isoform X4 n=1 Tax=Eurytemora carolleeae TaxID=1294199 RepID=UPI000C7918B9|nr:DNA repair protein REV1 isoform X4 [Eurytemora carolleeae]|eukprot:XP_023344570.1 DNA repair protein REV1-like isoform X4 [Eurytemora affinis]
MVRAENAPTETAKFLGHGVCDNVSRSVQLGSGTADQSRIYNQVLSMIKQMETKPQDIRGVGISVSKLDEKKTNSGNSILKFVKIKDQSGSNQNSSTNISPEKINASSSSFNPLNPEPKPQPVPEQEPMQVPKQVAQPEPEPEKQKSDETVLAEHNLDPEVFAQLPENIRNEILSEYNIGGGSRTRRLEDLSLEDCIPGPSSTLKENIEPRGSKSGAEHLSDLSFSQIDGGVLSELPIELRDEITTHFQDRKKQQEKPRVETAFDTLMRIFPKKTSPKKGRGRPKKGSSTDLRSKSSANIGRKHVDRDLKLHMINENSNSNSSDQFTEVNMRKPIPTPTFCGKASISEIRPLIKIIKHNWLLFISYSFIYKIFVINIYILSYIYLYFSINFRV